MTKNPFDMICAELAELIPDGDNPMRDQLSANSRAARLLECSEFVPIMGEECGQAA